MVQFCIPVDSAVYNYTVIPVMKCETGRFYRFYLYLSAGRGLTQYNTSLPSKYLVEPLRVT